MHAIVSLLKVLDQNTLLKVINGPIYEHPSTRIYFGLQVLMIMPELNDGVPGCINPDLRKGLEGKCRRPKRAKVIERRGERRRGNGRGGRNGQRITEC